MIGDYIFVYGTLKASAKNTQYFRLEGKSRFITDATVAGQLYDLGQYPGFVPNNEGEVTGEVYQITQAALVTELDEYEGCSTSDPEPHEYRREKMTVVGKDGQKYDAWIYVYLQPVNPMTLIESGIYP